MVGHCAVRHYAMGERSLDETPATDDDIAAMCDLVDEAMGAGALGFSTSRTLLHRVPDGRPVPGTWADERELLAIADVLGRRGHGVYEVAPRFERPGANYEGTRAEVHWMAEINRRTGRPVTFGLAQSNAGPGAVPQDPRARRRGGRAPAVSCARRPPRAASGCSSACSTARSSTARRRGPRCRRCRSTRDSPRCATRPDAPNCSPTAERTRLRSTGAACTCSRPTRVDYSADPRPRSPPTRERARRDDRGGVHRDLARDATVGRSSTTRSSTSAWTRSRSCSTTRGWRSGSATPVRTSA